MPAETYDIFLNNYEIEKRSSTFLISSRFCGKIWRYLGDAIARNVYSLMATGLND